MTDGNGGSYNGRGRRAMRFSQKSEALFVQFLLFQTPCGGHSGVFYETGALSGLTLAPKEWSTRRQEH